MELPFARNHKPPRFYVKTSKTPAPPPPFSRYLLVAALFFSAFRWGAVLPCRVLVLVLVKW
jgi:hypothetical protein